MGDAETARTPTLRRWFDAAALTERGVAEDYAQQLRERFEATELDELYLRDQATREGWLASGRFRQQLRSLRQALRQELGDADYDWVLYASGRNNRVSVQSVLHDSPAAEAGLRSGDVIERYDGGGVFFPRDLREATTAGRLGENVAVDVLRGGERLRFYLPRGPLGTRLGTTRRAPEQ